jgi:hypothetical protein
VLGRAPFCLECPSGMPVSDWWASMPDAAADVLKALATLLYSICPHAADPERLFSQLGFYEGQRRSGLAVDTLGMMATIKFRYNQQQPRYAYHLLTPAMLGCNQQVEQLRPQAQCCASTGLHLIAGFDAQHPRWRWFVVLLQKESLRYPKDDIPPDHIILGGPDCTFDLAEELKPCPVIGGGKEPLLILVCLIVLGFLP